MQHNSMAGVSLATPGHRGVALQSNAQLTKPRPSRGMAIEIPSLLDFATTT